jgi:hypothetical protein
MSMFFGDLSSCSLPVPLISSGSSRPSSLDSAVRFHFCSFGRQDAHSLSTIAFQIFDSNLNFLHKYRQMNTSRNEEGKLPGMNTYENCPRGRVPSSYVPCCVGKASSECSSTTTNLGIPLLPLLFTARMPCRAHISQFRAQTIGGTELSQNEHLRKNTRGVGASVTLQSRLPTQIRGR